MELQTILTAIVVFVFGATIGSFLNVVIWRMPREEQITSGRSHCPFCSKTLQPRDLIPILSFIMQRGRCRYCKKRISYRYPVIEFVVASLFLITFWVSVPVDALSWFLVLKIFFVIGAMTAVFVIDFEHYLILDRIVLPATIIILVMHLITDLTGGQGWVESQTLSGIIGAVAGYLPFYLLWKFSSGKWMGLGDAKFGLFLGATFGFPLVWLCFFLAFFVGSVVAVPLLLFKTKRMSSKIPFGTFLAIAGLLTLWFGEQIAEWYLGLIGFGS